MAAAQRRLSEFLGARLSATSAPDACAWLMTLMLRYRQQKNSGTEDASRATGKSALHTLCQGGKIWRDRSGSVAWLPDYCVKAEKPWEGEAIHAACKVPGCVQARAVRKLLAHRLSGESAEKAKAEWYEVVEGDHSLWDGVSEPYKHTIRAFLVYFHTQIQRHSTERFNFRNGSVGAHHPCLHALLLRDHSRKPGMLCMGC